MPKLTIAIPTKLQINANCILSLLSSISQIKHFQNEIRILPGKSNIDQARSILLTQWYDNATDDDLFLFIDSDQTFTQKDILDLIEIKSDVSVGVYSNAIGKPICFPVEPEKFFAGKTQDLYYGATGFMLIHKSICTKVIEYLRREHRTEPRFWISNEFRNIIPFFTQRFIESELNPGSGKEWLGEDFNFCWLTRKVGGSIKGMISKTLGHEVPQIKYFYPDTFNVNQWDNKSIVYYTGPSIVWNPSQIKTGLGGSETAIVNLSRFWQSKGYQVTVYTNSQDMIHEGVNYINYQKFNINDQFNILVLWRLYGCTVLQTVKAKKILLDVHDVPDQRYRIIDTFLDKINYIMVKSEYQKKLFPTKFHDKIKVIQNGINFEFFQKETKKNYNKLIYTSSYDRGLNYMLEYGFPKIREKVPDVEFHIYYGMDLVRDQKFKEHIQKLVKQPGVIEHGKIGQQELALERLNSVIHYYVGDFQEIDCISTKESVYAGCLPVTSNVGVFEERDYLKVLGDPKTREVQEKGAEEIIKLLTDKKYYDEQLSKISKSKIESWEQVGEKWINLFN